MRIGTISMSEDKTRIVRSADWFRRNGVEWEERNGWLIPASFGSFRSELEALRAGRGVIDWSDRGVLELEGGDALDYLNRVSTNEIVGSKLSGGLQTLLLTEKGRVIDSVLLLRKEKIILITSRGASDQVRGWLEKFIVADDVTVHDRTGEVGLFVRLLPPPGAAPRGESFGNPSVQIPFFSMKGELSFIEEPEAWFEGPLRDSGYMLVGNRAYERIRIEAGIPSYGGEMTGEFNPLELNLRNQISFTKGCYTGQEVVARLDTYRKVQRHLCLLQWPAEKREGNVTDLIGEGNPVGRVLSRTGPVAGEEMVFGLGIVRKEFARTGELLDIAGAGISAAITRVFND